MLRNWKANHSSMDLTWGYEWMSYTMVSLPYNSLCMYMPLYSPWSLLLLISIIRSSHQFWQHNQVIIMDPIDLWIIVFSDLTLINIRSRLNKCTAVYWLVSCLYICRTWPAFPPLEGCMSFGQPLGRIIVESLNSESSHTRNWTRYLYTQKAFMLEVPGSIPDMGTFKVELNLDWKTFALLKLHMYSITLAVDLIGFIGKCMRVTGFLLKLYQ